MVARVMKVEAIKSKETVYYEQGINGRYLRGSGCWKCRGEVENNVGYEHSVLTIARALAVD